MRIRLCMAMIGLTAAWALPALAALGDNVASVSNDRLQLHAQLKGVTSSIGFTVHEIEAPSGTLVREYVSPTGTVFAVSWTGPVKPDLRQLFGSYFSQYVSASSTVRHGAATRRHFQVKQPDLIVQSNGRMRAFNGRAYIPSLMPSGVTPSDIR
ncbi:MAG TPA: DUF2844 domain-containing protein [Steroidobacteraceae bacterium]